MTPYRYEVEGLAAEERALCLGRRWVLWISICRAPTVLSLGLPAWLRLDSSLLHFSVPVVALV